MLDIHSTDGVDMRYRSDRSISLEQLYLLNDSLFHEVKYRRNHHQFDYARLLSGLNRFRDKQVEALKQFYELLTTEPKPTVEPFLVDVIEYLNALDPDKEGIPGRIRVAVRSVVQTFNAAVRKTGGAPRAVFFDSDLCKWFDLKSKSRTQRLYRVILMNLLKHQLFIQTKKLNRDPSRNSERTGGAETITNTQKPSHQLKWTKAQNQDLLDHCMKVYLKATNEILGKEFKANQNNINSLKEDQKISLSKLMTEIKLINCSFFYKTKSINKALKLRQKKLKFKLKLKYRRKMIKLKSRKRIENHNLKVAKQAINEHKPHTLPHKKSPECMANTSHFRFFSPISNKINNNESNYKSTYSTKIMQNF